jgi:hypothetical protein
MIPRDLRSPPLRTLSAFRPRDCSIAAEHRQPDWGLLTNDLLPSLRWKLNSGRPSPSQRQVRSLIEGDVARILSIPSSGPIVGEGDVEGDVDPDHGAMDQSQDAPRFSFPCFR